MNRIARHRPSPAFVLAAIALFVALGGSAVALNGSNTVFSDDIVNQEVKQQDLALSSVGTGKVIDENLTGIDIAPNSLKGADIDESNLGTVPDAAKLGNVAASEVGQGFSNIATSFSSGATLDLTVPGVGTLKIECSNGGTSGNDADDTVGDFEFKNESGQTLVLARTQIRSSDQFVDSDFFTVANTANVFFVSGAVSAFDVKAIAAPTGTGGVAATFNAIAKPLGGSENCQGSIHAITNG